MVTHPAGRGLRAALGTIALATAIALASTGTLAAGIASAAPAPGPSATTLTISDDAYERKVQRHVNRLRAAHGLRALRVEACTDAVAERWAARLAATGRLAHQSVGAILSACGATYAAETLGRGRFGPRGLVRSWTRSPVHRAVLLAGHARHIGIGSHVDADGAWITAASFTRG